MRIISGANYEYKEFYEKLKQDTQKFGYDFSGYDYGELGDGEKFEMELNNPKDFTKYVGKIPDKPKLILNALEKHKEFLAYLDCDVRIKEDFKEVIGDYDFGVCVHDMRFHSGAGIDTRYPHITCYLNAGVLFINNTENARKFLGEWVKEVQLASAKSDQEALTNLLRKHIPEERWDQKDHNVFGVKVRFFPASKYNFIRRYGYTEKNPKIIHYTGAVYEKIAMGALLN